MHFSDLGFDDLLSPTSVDSFFEDYWEKKHLLIRRGDPSFYDSLLSFKSMDQCIAATRCGTAPGTLVIVPPPGSDAEREHPDTRTLRAQQLYRAFHAGNTIRMSGIHSYWAPAAAVATMIGEALSASIGVNAYMTPASSQAFPAHFDTHDVIVMQVDGSKEWYIYSDGYDLPVETLNHVQDMTSRDVTRVDESTVDVIQKTTLERGDFLYIPRGVPHKAVATDSPSLHLTFGVHPFYWVDIVRRALDFAATRNSDLRRSLPPGFASQPRSKEAMKTTFSEVAEAAFQNLDFKAAVNSLNVGVTGGHDYPPDGHFASLIAVDTIDADTPLERRKGLDCLVEVIETGARIRFASNEIAGPPAIGEALRFVRDNRTFKPRDLPGPFADKSKVVLSKRLIREGLVRILEP
ncbi:MAG: cupin domain-containing protein [Acidobacteriota bacterium]